MADHIPFVTGEEICNLVNELYPDSAFIRVPLDRAQRLLARLDVTSSLWLDPCVDGMHDLKTRRSRPGRKNTWFEFMVGFPNFEKIATPAYHAKPIPAEVDAFVKALMDRCATHKPAWITVPQLPLVTGSKRNKINRALAAATGRWKINSGFPGRLILPLVFTHQIQLKGRTERTPKVRQAEQCYHDAQADGFWVVESSLDDEKGSSTLRNRFARVISLHEELNERIPTEIRIAGPYWGLNVVLWARNLVNYPAIGIGSGYRFLLAGGPAQPPVVRLALPSLRRRVGVRARLQRWLDLATRRLDPSRPAYAELSEIKKRYTVLTASARAREQVARFYKEWFDTIAAVPKAGRSMALFQDLSAAYALGKSLPDLDDAGPARKPAAVAEPLMLSCL